MGNCCETPLLKVEETNSSLESRKGSVLFEKFSRLSDYRKKYEFIQQLGSGGFGKVRLFRDRKCIEMKYAIKTIKKNYLNKHSIQSMIREVEILRSLDHPNIVNYFETYEDEHYIHIVMEFIPGDNLYKVLANKDCHHFGENDMVQIITVLLKTVQFLHSNNIVHRDLKPENILFSVPGNYESLKIIDFGLSIEGKEKDSYRVGSPYYMAPEMVGGKFSFATDLWSIGVILFLMATGKQPFHAKNKNLVFEKIQFGAYDKAVLNRSKCSKELKDLIKKFLVVDQKKRINITNALNHPWMKEENLKSSGSNQIDSSILSSIRDFHNKNCLQKEILFVMAKISRGEEIQKLKDAFTAIDKDDSGEIEYSEIPLIFQNLGINPSNDQVNNIWKSLDFHQDGKINYTEFLAATISTIQDKNEEKLWAVFQYFDPDDTGFITANSVIEALKKSKLEVNEKELNEFFNKIKQINEGKISFYDFKSIFLGKEIVKNEESGS